MTEPTPKKDGVTVRVPEWLLDEVEDARDKMPRPRPSRGDLLAQAWQDCKGKAEPHEQLGPYHRKLAAILDSGDDTVIEAVTQNIDVFFDRLKPKAVRPRRKTGT